MQLKTTLGLFLALTLPVATTTNAPALGITPPSMDIRENS